MGFRDEFRGTAKTYAQFSLENTAKAGLQANEERLKALQGAYQRGIDRLIESQESSVTALRGELEYQSEQIRGEIQRGSTEVVTAIQQMTDYLGTELCEIRWAVERQTRVSKQILQVLLKSLDNESRQYWEQGVKCYDTEEYGIAKERFERALRANRTNYFAYQYLGFIAVATNDAEAAIRNFDLARKFADTSYHRALALSHLARSHYAAGQLETAADLSRSAAETEPQTANFWYECATYSVKAGRVESGIAALRKTIEQDWTYWATVAVNSDFDRVRTQVNNLLDELRNSQRELAHDGLCKYGDLIDMARKIGVTPDSLEKHVDDLKSLHQKLESNNVHIYLAIIDRARQCLEELYRATDAAASGRIADLRESLDEPKRRLKQLEPSYTKWNPAGGELFLVWFICAMFATFLIAATMISLGHDTLPSSDTAYFAFGMIAISIILVLLFRTIVNWAKYRAQVVRPKHLLEAEIRMRERTATALLLELQLAHSEIKKRMGGKVCDS